MSDETMDLSGRISAALMEYMFNHNGPHRIAGEEYGLATDEQYKSLHEDVTATDLPLVLVRRSDGQMFEVEVDAHVSETSPELRQEQMEHYRQMREAMAARGRHHK